MKNNWYLIYSQQNKVDSDTDIHAATEDVTHELEKGSKVKLLFCVGNSKPEIQQTEYLLVEILLVQEDKYLGQLQDEPKIIKDLSIGELIEFEEQHIHETDYIDPFDPDIKV